MLLPKYASSMLLLGALILVSSYTQSREITLSGIENTIDGEITASVLKQAYSLDNIDLKIIYMPAQRAIVTSSSGKVDGELFRTPKSISQYSSLIRVNQPIHYVNVLVATKSKNNIKNINELNGSSIGVVRGKLYQRLTKGLDQVSMVTRHSQLVKMLINDRVDAIILSEYTLKYYLEQESKEKTQDIVVFNEPIYSSPVFHYLHRNNRDLIPQLETRLGEIMESGEYERILSKYTHSVN